ncbi:MAG: replicative DNA helicase [Clostridia bacterium]|nr:replicative DNA helicase [Clostridia bacterium]MCR4885570.1 replicative DNA helicase [Clostridiales bacterium]
MPADTSFAPVPPHSTEAERSVLGAMLQSANAVSAAMETLTGEDFYVPAHKEIYDAARAVAERHSAVDLVTMDAELSRRGTLPGVGGIEYLIDLTQFVPTTANVKDYIRIVAEKSTLRRLIGASGEISKAAYAQEQELPQVLSLAEKQIFDIVMRRDGGEDLMHIRDVLALTYAQMEELARLKGQVAGVPTGFYSLDGLLTGLHGGELVLVGARPSMGKTSFAINLATNAARKGKKVAIFSLEMPREQIAMRILCSDARINMQSVRKGTLRDEEWVKLARSLAPLAQSEMYIDDTSGLTPGQLRSRCRRMMMDHGLDLIVVDYLQLMGSDVRAESRQVEVSQLSRSLKAIAQELKVPLVACAQLSRANEKRGAGGLRPMLSDLRDSGSIEQDADVVMFLHREAYYKREEGVPDNVAEVIVAKQRNGPLGTVKLAWLGEYTLFDNLAADM